MNVAFAMSVARLLRIRLPTFQQHRSFGVKCQLAWVARRRGWQGA